MDNLHNEIEELLKKAREKKENKEPKPYSAHEHLRALVKETGLYIDTRFSAKFPEYHDPYHSRYQAPQETQAAFMEYVSKRVNDPPYSIVQVGSPVGKPQKQLSREEKLQREYDREIQNARGIQEVLNVKRKFRERGLKTIY